MSRSIGINLNIVKTRIILIIHLMLTGCVIYPQRHVAEPRYEVKIAGASIVRVILNSSNNSSIATLKPILSPDTKAENCDGGSELKLTKNNNFTSGHPIYGWFKVAIMVPADSFKSFEVCATGSDGSESYWAGGISTFIGDYPEVVKFSCDVISGDLYCSIIIDNVYL